MKKHFLVVNIEDGSDYFIVTDLNEIIREMYEPDLDNGEDFETVKGWFYNNFVVFFFKQKGKDNKRANRANSRGTSLNPRLNLTRVR